VDDVPASYWVRSRTFTPAKAFSIDMLKILAFLTKREGIGTQAFIEYYENNHVRVICDLAPTPIVYKHNFLMRATNSTRKTARSALTS
jgi:hypothetical protein